MGCHLPLARPSLTRGSRADGLGLGRLVAPAHSDPLSTEPAACLPPLTSVP